MSVRETPSSASPAVFSRSLWQVMQYLLQQGRVIWRR